MKQLKLFFVAAFLCLYAFTTYAQPENLYFIGGPFSTSKGNWEFRDLVKLQKDVDNPFIFRYNGYIGFSTFGGEPGNFKILTGSEWVGYHPAGTENQLVGAEQVGVAMPIRYQGDDTKWYVPNDRSGDGYYSIVVDTEKNTFLIESFVAASSTEFPVGLFIIGGPFVVNNLDWNPPVEVGRMVRDMTDPNIFHYRGYMERNQWGNEPGNFKILINALTWDDAFHPAVEQDVDLTSLVGVDPSSIRRGGTDNKWYLPEDGSGNGFWDFTINAVENTIKINEFTHDFDYFDNVYITGSAMPNGWTASEPETMNKTSRGVYSWTGVVKAGEFKFLKYLNIWEGGYAAGTENENVVLNQDHTIVYEKNYHHAGSDYKFIISPELDNKNVQITLDLNTKTMKVISVSTNADVAKNEEVKVNVAGGKVFLTGFDDQNYSMSIYSIEGRQIAQKSFIGKTETNLSKGSYIVVVRNQSDIALRTKILVY